jgi:hypothetical protein
MIREEIKAEIKKDTKLKKLIGLEMGVTERAVEYWLENDSPKLETNPVIRLLKKTLNKSRTELVA